MKKFRKLWYAFVFLAVLVTIGYQWSEKMKEDSSGPVLTCESERIKASINDGEEKLLEGITAEDKKDGDVTDSILIEKMSGLYDKNKRMVTYVAFDSDDHITKIERELIYTDYVSPKFSLSGSLRFRIGETVNIDKIVKVDDCIDGDISNKVKVQMQTSISNRAIGVYDIVYEVTNTAGDTVKLPVQVEIYESSRNEIDLNLKQYLIYYEGEEPDYKKYLKSVKSGTIEQYFEGVKDQNGEAGTVSKDRVTVNSMVNPDVPGAYPVYFYYEHYGEIYTQATEVMYVLVQ